MNLKKRRKYNFFADFSMLKIILITAFSIIGIVVVAVIFGSDNTEKIYTIEINGDTSVVVYKGSNYVDPGAKAYDEENVDLSNQILVDSDLNVNKVGRYEIIYSLGDIFVKRVVRVIDNPNSEIGSDGNGSNLGDLFVKNGETTLILKGKETVYIDVYGAYKEEGYTATDVKDGNITKKVDVTHNVDNTKPGSYQVVYTVKNSSGITTSIKRNVIVMSVEMALSLENSNYTNSDVGIKVNISDEYFDHLVLPNGNKAYTKNYIYKVSENGTYEFISYNKHGAIRNAKITVSNIDKTKPSAQCSAEYKNGKTIVTIKSTDNVGIGSYVVNGKSYSSSVVSQNSLVTNNSVVVYDMAGNSVSTSCVVVPKVYIDSIKKDGVIITVNAGKINSDIAGYYFSYSRSRPNKETGGFLSTSNDSVDVVRLPGTTYVWVEDTNGNISELKSISISNDALLITAGNDYKTLQNISLEEFLKNNGWSKTEFDKLIARSVRAAGVYSKDAAATAGVALQTVLAQKYKVKLPYWWGGKSWDYGTNKDWGTYKTKYSEEYDKWYYYYGFDCSGFVTWAYVNAGYDINKGQYPSYGGFKSYSFTKENGDIGDVICTPGHVKMIIGKTEDGFICAEASRGVNLIIHKYSNSSGAYIVKGESLGQKYPKDVLSNIPTGF